MSPSDDEDSKHDDLISQPAEGDGGTRVDLGDDLIEKTAMFAIPGTHPDPVPSPPPLSGPPDAEAPPPGPIAPEQIADHLQSARILMGEGILEDAKRILRRVLLADPSRLEARKMLEGIHEIELKQIFGESETPRRRLRLPQTEVEVSAETVMRGLDRDLKLGIFGDNGGEGLEPQLSLFKDRAAMEEFGRHMDRDFAAHPAPERIDLGIAFLEMGLASLAVRHFQAAINQLRLVHQDASASDPLIAAAGLLAYALILDARAFEATIQLQPLLNDVDIDRPRKLDLIYLMGRAFEAMGKGEDACQWYAQAAEIEPHYRDVDDRLKKASAR